MMTKRLRNIALAMAIGLGVLSVAHAANPVADTLVVNASFETDLSNWSGGGTRITTGQYSGNGGLQITPGIVEQQDVFAKLTPGHTYHLSVWMKVPAAADINTNGMGIEIKDASGNNLVLTGGQLSTFSSSYQQVALDFTMPASGATYAIVYAEDWGTTDTANFDDFQLVDTSPTFTPSANDTTIPSATSITDNLGNVWTLNAGVINENGVAQSPASSTISLVLWHNNAIYAEDSTSAWTKWTPTWAASSDPRGSSDTFTTISSDWAEYNVQNGGPYWALNSTWNNGNLKNGTDYTQSLTLDNQKFQNNSVIQWSWPSTPAPGMVYSYPGVFYGTYGNIAPTTSVPSKQISAINTLTLSHNITLGGANHDIYDGIYDMYLTSAPDGNTGTATHEVEIWFHAPSYSQTWLNSLPQHPGLTDANGIQWHVAYSPTSNPPILAFYPLNYPDLTNATIDFKALLLQGKRRSAPTFSWRL